MSILRETLRVRDEPASAHQTAASGHPSALPALLAHLHAQQHRAPAHRARASPPGDTPPPSRPITQPYAVRTTPVSTTELPLLFPTGDGDLLSVTVVVWR